ncbi:DUF1615 domain-containing protein [Cognatilysobacter bugurensis]|uniref:DUF1615 domain-containing protein n=1 Tax=Cognatilysobacter bugurensis TaxID=543356 RepID=UPI001E597B5D|nr:DUF1615 domain-containing protein [Lysobacter bugurensis]
MAACDRGPEPPTPAEVRARISHLLPATLADRGDWAYDIERAFSSLEIEPSDSNVCSVLAITAQESSFAPDPVVPGLAKIARKEIDRRAERMRVPAFVVRAALQLESPDGRTWEQRIAAVRTEKQLNTLFEELIDALPMGRRLFSGVNPVRTGGPMQVSISFAEAHARQHRYPYSSERSIRREVFTRRGGLYFGIAHLLAYPASYPSPLYRFADFNAGRYASRNAGFQNAVSKISGVALALDGDLLHHNEGSDAVSRTEAAVRSIARMHWDMTDADIRRALNKSGSHAFEDTDLYQHVFSLAERKRGKPLPRQSIPRITLESPKITRKLTTEWFATRVDARYRRCMAKARRS